MNIATRARYRKHEVLLILLLEQVVYLSVQDEMGATRNEPRILDANRPQ
jgi:hypothetical protein